MKLEIGKILKAQGIGGEVKIAVAVDEAKLLKGVTHMYIDGRVYEVKGFRGNDAFAYVKLDGVTTRNDAEELRNKTIFADKDEVALARDRYFVDDLVSCQVLCDGKVLGKVAEVLQYGAADVFACNGADGKEFSFPFLKDVVVRVDVDGKRIVVEPKRFGEVAVYED